MDDKTVTPGEPPSEPSVWADISAELHKLADDVLTLVGEPAPDHFAIDLHPHNADRYHKDSIKNRPETVAAVNTVASVLLGKAGVTYPVGASSFHHGTEGARGPIALKVYQSVADPAAVDPEQEIARLRAEVAELKRKQQPAPDFKDGPCEDPVCPNASWPHSASSDLAELEDAAQKWARADAPEDGDLTQPGELVRDGEQAVAHIADHGPLKPPYGTAVPADWKRPIPPTDPDDLPMQGKAVIHVRLKERALTECGLVVADLPHGHSVVASWSDVSTCLVCADQAPF